MLIPRLSVGVPSGPRYGSSIVPVKFSSTPSIISFTLVGRYRPMAVAARRSTSSSSCSTPRPRSHQSAPTTFAVSSPRPARATYARSSVSGVTIASCQVVIPSEWR